MRYDAPSHFACRHSDPSRAQSTFVIWAFMHLAPLFTRLSTRTRIPILSSPSVSNNMEPNRKELLHFPSSSDGENSTYPPPLSLSSSPKTTDPVRSSALCRCCISKHHHHATEWIGRCKQYPAPGCYVDTSLCMQDGQKQPTIH